MKFGTIVKIGALAAAAASTAAGTIFVTTKALAKVGGKPAEEPMDTSNGPIIKRPLAPADPIPADPVPVAPAPIVEPEVAPAPAFVAPNPTPAPVFATPEPTPMPVFTAPEPEPVSFATTPAEPVVEPVTVDLPSIEAPAPVAAPVEEPTPAYNNFEYALPYMAGNSDDKTIVTGGVEIPVEEPIAEPVVEIAEENLPADDVSSSDKIETSETADQPLNPAPVVEAAEENLPVDDFSSSDKIETSETADQPLNPAPVVEEPVEEIDLSSVIAPNPAAEQSEPVLPVVEEVAPIVEPVVAEPAPAPVTFGNLSSTEDYIETIAVDEPAPVVEPIVEAPVADKGKEQKIGGAIVSDKASNANIAAVAAKFSVNADNLVSIEAEGNMPMVFEFLYGDMRNDATLVSVYFIMNGEATLPPDSDKENVLAFGRNFITGNEELKAFLA